MAMSEWVNKYERMKLTTFLAQNASANIERQNCCDSMEVERRINERIIQQLKCLLQ